MPMVAVVSCGPPCEMSQIWLNTLKSQIIESMVMTMMLGEISGTTICQ